jgi:hypothetical protein
MSLSVLTRHALRTNAPRRLDTASVAAKVAALANFDVDTVDR